MKIWAYGDTHIGTIATLMELELAPDFSKCASFCELVKQERPDTVICVGDFIESIWDTEAELLASHGETISNLRKVTHHFLSGNHDRGNLDSLTLAGILFLHGHQWERADDGYIERLHLKANKQPGFTVIGHTHSSCLGENFMDVGSLTLNGTFGEIIDSTKQLRKI